MMGCRAAPKRDAARSLAMSILIITDGQFLVKEGYRNAAFFCLLPSYFLLLTSYFLLVTRCEYHRKKTGSNSMGLILIEFGFSQSSQRTQSAGS
jgi:hypothetical protein